MKSKQVLGWGALTLFALELLVILGSWIVAAAWPELPCHSLISMDGVRWLFGSFTESMATPLLVWLVVWSIACGALAESGLWHAFKRLAKGTSLAYRERLGLSVAGAELLLALLITVLLTCVPHALLLNAMGHLYPSAFSESFVPYSAFLAVVCSLTYGGISGQLATISAAYQSLTAGIRRFAALFPLYILAMQLMAAIKFVL